MEFTKCERVWARTESRGCCSVSTGKAGWSCFTDSSRKRKRRRTRIAVLARSNKGRRQKGTPMKTRKTQKRMDHSGSTFDSFLEEEGIGEEVEAVAIKRVLAWQLEQAMQQQQKSKQAMAKELRTSRSQLDRLLDPQNVSMALGPSRLRDVQMRHRDRRRLRDSSLCADTTPSKQERKAKAS